MYYVFFGKNITTREIRNDFGVVIEYNSEFSIAITGRKTKLIREEWDYIEAENLEEALKLRFKDKKLSFIEME